MISIKQFIKLSFYKLQYFYLYVCNINDVWFDDQAATDEKPSKSTLFVSI